LLIWTGAAAFGVAALVRESEVAFTILKLAGAVYLVYLGAQALLASRRHAATEPIARMIRAGAAGPCSAFAKPC
jgi:threonine/homoserine/homoserine lactone efflux protein